MEVLCVQIERKRVKIGISWIATPCFHQRGRQVSKFCSEVLTGPLVPFGLQKVMLTFWALRDLNGVFLFSADFACMEPLGMGSGEITPEQITASSQYNPNWSPERSRLNYPENGWTPSDDTVREWIQVSGASGSGGSSLRCWIRSLVNNEITSRGCSSQSLSSALGVSARSLGSCSSGLNLSAPLRCGPHLAWILFTHVFDFSARYRDSERRNRNKSTCIINWPCLPSRVGAFFFLLSLLSRRQLRTRFGDQAAHALII